MSPEIPDSAFLALKLPSYLSADTTPAVDPDFRGFQIAAPRRLRAGFALRLPVSAVARFGAESAKLPSPLWDSVSAVVVEVEKNQCWVGTLMDPYRVPITPPPDDESSGTPEPGGSAAPGEIDEIPEVESSGVASECAHVDLRELLELPPTPGSYEIHLTWGPWASNRVRVVVEREED